MAIRERVSERANRRARRVLTELGEELRVARVDHGLSQKDVGEAAHLSRWQIGRLERARYPGARLEDLIRVGSVVGLDISVRAFPGPSPLRDAAHRKLLRRFTSVVDRSVRVRFEVPLPDARDQRGWDATLGIQEKLVAVEAETRARDGQSLQRRLALKLRDDPRVSYVILVLANTRGNRQMLAEYRDALSTDFPVSQDDMIAALRAGRDPCGSGIVLI